MFYVNDDDIEGLFRTAAENYDINAEQAADFNSVLKALNEDNGEEQKPEQKKRRFLIFWWFVLLPLMGLLLWNSTLFTNNDNNSQKETVKSNNNQAQQNNAGTGNKTSLAQTEKAEGPANTESALTGATSKQTEDNSELNARVIASAKANSKPATTNANALLKDHAEQISIKPSATKDLSPLNDYLTAESKQQAIAATAPAALATVNEKKQTEQTANTADPRSSITDTSKNVVAAQQLTKDSASKTTVNKKDNKKTKTLKSNYFYAGAAASVDLTFIKFQKTTTPGFNAGIVAGYRFNKKWQIETGLIIDKKNYYTDGEYFDKSEVPYLNWVDLKSVSGYCSMYEIPLNTRFNFSEMKNHTWFASAGISSYLMKKEYYNYGYMYNGSYRNRDYTYTTPEKDWAAVMNLSAGYELKAGAKNYLRLEPYYKLPLKGVGTGSLPLSSAGLNVAFTRRIP